MSSLFWVIGGEYSDTHFTTVVEGSAQAFGPFRSYEDAKQVWRDRSIENRHKAHMRFTIATEGVASQHKVVPIAAPQIAPEQRVAAAY